MDIPIAVGVGVLQQPVSFVRGTNHLAQVNITNLSAIEMNLVVRLISVPNSNGFQSFAPVEWTITLLANDTKALQRNVAMSGQEGVDGGVVVQVEDTDYGDMWEFDFDPVTIIGPDVSADLVWVS